MQPKMGGKFHLKLNIGARPIANKYREGKMKRTLKRELKVREIVEMETLETSDGRVSISQGSRQGGSWCTRGVSRSASVWAVIKSWYECSCAFGGSVIAYHALSRAGLRNF